MPRDAGRVKRRITLAAAVLIAFPLGFLLSHVHGGDDVWRIPPWNAGDRVEWEYLSFDSYTGDLKSRTTSEWVLRGPVERPDGDDVPHAAYRWERLDVETPGYDWSTLDLERGISFEFNWPVPTRSGPLTEYAPNKDLTFGVQLQGKEVREGETWVLPVGLLEGEMTFKVSSITSETLKVEATRIDSWGLPYQSVRNASTGGPTHYIYTYGKGSPYPSSMTVWVPAAHPWIEDDALVKVTERRLLSAEWSGTAADVPTNRGVGERFKHREAERATPGATGRFIDSGVDSRFPASEILMEVEADEGLQRYLDAHPAAELIDVATMTLDGEQNETIVWNLTWADRDADRWHSLVRAKTIPITEDLLAPLGLVAEQTVRESFGPWRTMSYTLEIPWMGPSRAPQLTLSSALELFEKRSTDVSDPVLVRWGPLVTDANHKPIYGEVHFVSQAPMWAVATGDLGYQWTAQGTLKLSRTLDTFWMLAESGSIAMTPFAEPFPSDL